MVPVFTLFSVVCTPIYRKKIKVNCKFSRERAFLGTRHVLRSMGDEQRFFGSPHEKTYTNYVEKLLNLLC